MEKIQVKLATVKEYNYQFWNDDDIVVLTNEIGSNKRYDTHDIHVLLSKLIQVFVRRYENENHDLEKRQQLNQIMNKITLKMVELNQDLL